MDSLCFFLEIAEIAKIVGFLKIVSIVNFVSRAKIWSIKNIVFSISNIPGKNMKNLCKIISMAVCKN